MNSNDSFRVITSTEPARASLMALVIDLGIFQPIETLGAAVGIGTDVLLSAAIWNIAGNEIFEGLRSAN